MSPAQPPTSHGLETPSSTAGAASVTNSLSSPHEADVRADQVAGLSPSTAGDAPARRRSVRNAAALDHPSRNSSANTHPLLPAGSGFRGHEWTCPHYERQCWMRADCCAGSYVACRHCHNEAADHQLDRFSVTHVACRTCGAEDVPIGKTCGACGVDFARYYCKKCNLMEDDVDKVEQIYHCDSCGVCRCGRGLGIDNHHCNRCGCCVPIEHKDSHPCIPQASEASCPVCMDGLSHSLTQVIFMRCGHAIHESCFREYTKNKYTCPICWKSLTDMSRWIKALDEYLERERELHPLSKELAARQSDVHCNDCLKRSTVPWHYQHHKCQNCGSYNTRVV